MDWFLHDKDLRLERVNSFEKVFRKLKIYFKEDARVPVNRDI